MKNLIRKIVFTTALLAICNSVYAQQPEDLSGTYAIKANSNDKAAGTHLSIWTYGEVVSYKGGETKWTIKKVGDDGDKRLYTLEQKGKYLSVKDGTKIISSDKPGQWIVWKASNGYAIMWYEDATKGANALSLIKTASGYATRDGHAHYLVNLARNNAGGKGNSHQVWELTKKD